MCAMKNKKLFSLLNVVSWLLLTLPATAFGQDKIHDTNYYKTFPDKSTVRLYFSKKYTSFHIPSINNDDDFKYRPNTSFTTGAGITYNNISLNLSYGFSVFNPDDEKGKTKSIDFEGHIYPGKWAIDLLGIRHKGLHIYPKGYTYGNSNEFYYRPDATMILTGIGIYRVTNTDRFSYNAAMIQSEWQQKSAGTFLYGGEVYYGSLNGDSSLIPTIKETSFWEAGINKLHFVNFGVGAGYGYTFVVSRHFFATGSAIANINVSFSTEDIADLHLKKTSVNPSFIYKAAIGYNSDNWIITANWAANTLWTRANLSTDAYEIPTGNYRFIVAKRIGKLFQKKK
jgi:hypothetical protein